MRLDTFLYVLLCCHVLVTQLACVILRLHLIAMHKVVHSLTKLVELLVIVFLLDAIVLNDQLAFLYALFCGSWILFSDRSVKAF